MSFATHSPGALVIGQSAPNPEDIARLLRLIDLKEVVAALVIVISAYFLSRFVSATLERLGEGAAKRRLLLKKIATFVRLGIFLLAFHLVVMTFLEGQEKLLIGLGGTIAVAAGLALKDTVSSLVAGFLILVDQPFQVGDRVRFDESYGEVTEIGLRSVRIRTLDGDEVAIPNNRFLTEAVTSASAGTLDMMVVVDFHIAITEDAELAKQLVYETCVTSRYVYLDKPVSMRLREVETGAGLAVRVTCKAYIIDARYETDYLTDVSERVKDAFREHRIQRPYFREYMVKSAERVDHPEGTAYVHSDDLEPRTGGDE